MMLDLREMSVEKLRTHVRHSELRLGALMRNGLREQESIEHLRALAVDIYRAITALEEQKR